MFTGIVRGPFRVSHVKKSKEVTRYSVELTPDLSKDLKIGASVAVDGVCQTAVEIQNNQVSFDAIPETLRRTTLQDLKPDQLVNIERAARLGDEIGGHLVSGHVYGRAQISKTENLEDHRILHFSCPAEWTRYLFTKGFIALDGASLTLVDVDEKGIFSVHLIPETIRITTLGRKKEGDWVNVELDSQTQAIVETVERVLQRKHFTQ